MIRISVIVPIYNMEKRLDYCLQSLERQSMKDIEVILINDGSQDNSISIIRRHMALYPKLYKLINRDNKGISVSRNEGIKLAKGEFLSFVDSDDFIEHNMLEKLYQTIIYDKSDIVVCNYNKVYDNKKSLCQVNKKNYITNLYQKPQLIYKMDYGPCNKLYKKVLFKDIIFPINVKYEDLETILKVFLKAHRISFITDSLYNYYQNSQGETFTINEKVFDIFKILLALKKDFINKPKKLWYAYQELCISKIYIYNQLVAKSRQRELSDKFYQKGYQFINNNFYHWRLRYLLKMRSINNFLLRLIQINPYLYNQYISYKLRKK